MQFNVKENANFSPFNTCIQLNEVPLSFLWTYLSPGMCDKCSDSSSSSCCHFTPKGPTSPRCLFSVIITEVGELHLTSVEPWT